MLLSLFLLAVDGCKDQSSEINHLSLSPIASEVLSLSAPSVVSTFVNNVTSCNSGYVLLSQARRIDVHGYTNYLPSCSDPSEFFMGFLPHCKSCSTAKHGISAFVNNNTLHPEGLTCHICWMKNIYDAPERVRSTNLQAACGSSTARLLGRKAKIAELHISIPTTCWPVVPYW